MLRYKTEVAWFSRLVRHPARKRSGVINWSYKTCKASVKLSQPTHQHQTTTH